MAEREYAVVGRIRRAHGIRGELAVEAITDEPDAIFAPGRRVFAGTVTGQPAGEKGEPPRELTVVRSSPFKGGFIVTFTGIIDRNEAERWRDRYLLLPIEELAPPGDNEVYFHELIGLRVELVSGESVGEITELYELPQGIVLDVRRPNGGGSVVIPYTPDIVSSVDLERRVVVVTPPEGMLE